MRGRSKLLDVVGLNWSRGASRRPESHRRVPVLALGLVVVMLASLLFATSASAAPGVFAWGANDDGQLGTGSTTGPSKCLVDAVEHACSPTPVMAGELGEVSAVSAGQFHSLALLGDGTVMAWGRNSSGQLGTGNTTGSSVPVAVPGLSEVTAVTAGSIHSLALLANGTVVAWGANESGQLGNGTTIASDVPVAVSGLSAVKAIAAGNGYSLALLENGDVMAWGTNQTGQLGDGTTTNRSVPVAVSGVSTATSLAAGFAHSLALLADGTVVAWGYNRFGQLGDGTNEGPSLCTVNSSQLPCSKTPVPVSSLSGVTAVAAGEQHSLALETGGAVAAWGGNEEGELGNGTRVASPVPVLVSELSGATGVAAGGRSSFALLEGGSIKAWGENAFGQLGDGTQAERLVPVAVCGLVGVSGVATRGAHTLAYGGTAAQCPAVTSISPKSGPTAGATTVTITGTDLSGATAVKFGTASAASFTVESPTTITAVAPPGTGNVHVTVTTSGGTSRSTFADLFSYVSAPTVTSISPTSGGSSGGTVVTITGTSLKEASAVKFGSANAAAFTVNSPTSITATSPAGSATVDVTVTTIGGTSATGTVDQFAYFTQQAPEFGRCLKVTAGHGTYGSGTCTTVGGTKGYEWYPGFVGSKPLVKTHFTTAVKALTELFLETTGAQRITCKGGTGHGEYSGTKTVGGVVWILTGCHRGELGTCSSAAAGEGEIITSTLGGQLGIVKASTEGPAKNKLGLSLRPAGEAPLAEFTCGGVPVVVRGAVIEEVKANTMLLTVTLKYAETKTLQKPARFEGGPAEVLEMSINGEPFHQAGLAATTVQTNEEKVEISSVA
ncbi:MAG TPA: IPT/TIG domain-containing protein [Solirubrobacteraceae bacterium]